MLQDKKLLEAISSDVVLKGGILSTTNPVALEEENDSGLKLVLVLDGSLSYCAFQQKSTQISGPAFHMSVSQSPYTIEHHFEEKALHYLAIRIPLENLIEQFEIDTQTLTRKISGQTKQLFMTDRRAGKMLQILGQQMLNCPFQGAVRNMYLSGKALELTAVALSELTQDNTDKAVVLKQKDIERLHAVKRHLMTTLQQPSGLADLAKLAGCNVSKLTTGFRQLFGQSIYEFIREQRLLQAYQLVSSGEMSITEAAYTLGYTHSHFSKVFKKRFGVIPRALIRKN